MIMRDLVIRRHPGLGSDPPKRVGLGKGSHRVHSHSLYTNHVGGGGGGGSLHGGQL